MSLSNIVILLNRFVHNHSRMTVSLMTLMSLITAIFALIMSHLGHGRIRCHRLPIRLMIDRLMVPLILGVALVTFGLRQNCLMLASHVLMILLLHCPVN